jgi:hypothetical protein
MTNKQRFRARIALLQEKGFDIGFDNVNGQDRITNRKESANLSDRTTPARLIQILQGLEAGIALERQRIDKTYPNLIDYLEQVVKQVNVEPVILAEIVRFLKDLDRQPWDI